MAVLYNGSAFDCHMFQLFIRASQKSMYYCFPRACGAHLIVCKVLARLRRAKTLHTIKRKARKRARSDERTTFEKPWLFKCKRQVTDLHLLIPRGRKRCIQQRFLHPSESCSPERMQRKDARKQAQLNKSLLGGSAQP